MSHIYLSNMTPKDEQENSGSSRTSDSTPELGFVPMCQPGSKIGMVDENSTAIRIQDEAEEADNRNHRRATMTSEQRGLSKVSDLYDRDHKGYLDPTEEAMRRMDSKNLGFLDNNKVYQIMQTLQLEQQKSQELIASLQKEHQKSMSLKRGIVYMSIFAFLLAISNIGTSFAAARLAKDTTISGDEMVTTNGGVRVSTTPKDIVLTVNEVQGSDDVSRHRMLQQVCANVAGTGLTCDVLGQIDYADAIALYQQFCPLYPGITSPAQCTNIGLSQVLLKCGTRLTTIMGGSQFPTRGLPGQDTSFFVFPSPSTLTREGTPGSDYFQAFQWVQEPVASFSLSTSPITTSCQEFFAFKLYCPSSGGGFGTCFMIHTYDANTVRCTSQVQLCENPSVAGVPPTTRRLGAKSAN